MTPEGKVKEAVKKLLSASDVYWHCPVQNGMGSPSLDFICCYKGMYFAIETKAHGKLPTVRQLDTIGKIQRAGGTTFVIDGDLTTLENWLHSC